MTTDATALFEAATHVQIEKLRREDGGFVRTVDVLHVFAVIHRVLYAKKKWACGATKAWTRRLFRETLDVGDLSSRP